MCGQGSETQKRRLSCPLRGQLTKLMRLVTEAVFLMDQIYPNSKARIGVLRNSAKVRKDAKESCSLATGGIKSERVYILKIKEREEGISAPKKNNGRMTLHQC